MSSTRRVARNGTYYCLNGPEHAPVVVLIHGLGLTLQTWREHLQVLTQHYRVLSYDLFGHGRSAAPPQSASLSVYAQQLLELLDELGIERAALVGFSLGGMINRRIAIDAPERVTALVILNSPHERGAAAQALVEEQASTASSGGPRSTLAAALARWFTSGFLQQRPEVVDEISQWILANDPEHYAACRWVLARGVVELIRPDPPISLPTLVMSCEHDVGSTPAMAEAIAAEIAGASLHIIPGLRHLGLIERPELFSLPVRAFLDGFAET